MATSDLFLFVSHVVEDRGAALEVVDELERRGVSCWIAPRDVQPGRPFDEEIVTAIEGSRAMLLIFSEHCNDNVHIRREVTVAGESRKLIIPFRIEDAPPRRGLRVRLSDLHWIDGFAMRERAIDQVIRSYDPHLAQRLLDEERERADGQRRAEEARKAAEDARTPEEACGTAEEEQGAAEQLAKVTGEQPGTVSFVPSDEVSATAHDDKDPWSRPDDPRASQPVIPAGSDRPAAKNYRVMIAGLAIMAIVGATWVGWSFFSAKPAPPPTAGAADILIKGKAALERKDYAEAMRWFRLAAERGNARAQTYVGYFYDKGLGVPRDYNEAMRWYREAADLGNAPAQKNIGNFYEHGTGVTQNYGEAMRWFRLAADQGNAAAQTNIGYLYQNGLGVPQNYLEAMQWFRKAANQGEDTAQNDIGYLFERGLGVPQDYSEALRWYQMAADQGNIDAEYNIALLYADGRGVPPDLAKARQWMQKAADAGDFDAKKWIGDHGG
jgi:TPR repeat protein